MEYSRGNQLIPICKPIADLHERYKIEMHALSKAFAAMHRTVAWRSLSRSMRKVAARKLYEQIEMLGGNKI